MSTDNPYEEVCAIARYYIEIPDGKRLYNHTPVIATMPFTDSPIYLTLYTNISGREGIVKRDFLDLKQGMILNHWGIAICDKDNKCKYCGGQGCIFLRVRGRNMEESVVYDYNWKDNIDYATNTVAHYQKHINISELSNIVTQHDKQIKELQTEIQQLKSQISHLMYMPGGIGARAAQEHFHSLL